MIEFVDRATEPLRASVGGFFVESHLHPPKLEQQVAELASGEFVTLAEKLVERGLVFEVSELDAMYVHVELDLGVRRRLGDIRATRPAGVRRRAAPVTRLEGRRPTEAEPAPGACVVPVPRPPNGGYP